MEEIDFDTFLSVELRSGKVVKAEPFPEARKPASNKKFCFSNTVKKYLGALDH